MIVAEQVVQRTASAESRSTASRSARLIHVVFALLALLVLNATANLGGFVSADETVAHEQVEQLMTGSWVIDDDDPVLVEAPSSHPLESVSWAVDGYAPYAKHPVFPALLVPGELIAGRFGRFATVALAAVLGAAALSSIAERRSAGLWTGSFWVLIAGTTLPFHGAALWAHSLGLLAVALTLSSFEAAASGRAISPRLWAQLLIGVVAAGWLRSEASVFFVIFGGAAVLVGFVRRIRPLVAVGASAAVAAVVAFQAESLVRQAILGDQAAGALSAPSTATFDLGARRFLVELWVFGFNGTLVSLLPFVGLALLVFEAARSSTDPRGMVPRPVILSLAVACYVGGALSASVMSFFAVIPLIVLGVISVQRRDPFVDLAVLGSLLYFVGIVMTSYASAGGGDWGGRYLLLAVAPLGIVAMPGLRFLLKTRAPVVLAAMACSGVLLVAMAGDVLSLRGASADLADELVSDLDNASAVLGESSERIIVVSDPRVSRLLVENEVPGRLYLAADAERLGELLAALDRSGRPRPPCVAFIDVLSPIVAVDVDGLASGRVSVFGVRDAEFVAPEQAFCSAPR